MANKKSVVRKPEVVKLHPDALRSLEVIRLRMSQAGVQTRPSIARAVEYAAAYANMAETHGIDIVSAVVAERGRIS